MANVSCNNYNRQLKIVAGKGCIKKMIFVSDASSVKRSNRLTVMTTDYLISNIKTWDIKLCCGWYYRGQENRYRKYSVPHHLFPG